MKEENSFIEAALSILERSGKNPAFSISVAEQLDLQKYAIYCVQKNNPANEPLTPVFYTQKEATEILHCSFPTIISYRAKGWLQGRKVGAKILYTQADLDEAVKVIAVNKYKRA